MTERPPVLILAALVTVAACTPAAPVAPVPSGNGCVVVDDNARSSITFPVAAPPATAGLDDPVAGAQLYETLVRVDCTDRVIAGLAVRWSSENGREWRFEIRAGASFSDGTPVSARSVAAALSTLPLLAGVAATGEYDLRVILHEPSDVRLFAGRDLTVRRSEGTGIPPGTGPYVPLPDSRDRALRLVARSSADEGSAASASRPTPDTIVVRAFGSDMRTAIDAGVDLLVTHDAATVAYARARSGYLIAPLTWSTAYVLAAHGGGHGLAEVDPDAFPSAVVGAVSRPARPPFWWSGCGAAPEATDSSSAPPAGSTARQTGRILFLRSDPVARAIAERITALARGRAPEWLASRIAFDGTAAAAGVGHAELLAALEDGNALAVVTRLKRAQHGGCNAESGREYRALLTRWHVTPLVDTRDDLVYRPGIGRVTVDADGTLRFAGR